jgi:hypothetical protein
VLVERFEMTARSKCHFERNARNLFNLDYGVFSLSHYLVRSFIDKLELIPYKNSLFYRAFERA